MARSVLRCCAVSLLGRAHWLHTSWRRAAMSGVDRTRTLATTPKVTCRHTTRRFRCCCRTVSLASSCHLLRAHGTITSWVSACSFLAHSECKSQPVVHHWFTYLSSAITDRHVFACVCYGFYNVYYHFFLFFSHMCVMNHNCSARKWRLHLQSVARIIHHSALLEDSIWQCGTSSGSRHKDTDQCL